MNAELVQLAAAAALDDADHESLRLAFCLACAQRVRHLLEEPRALQALSVFERYVNGQCDRAAWQTAVQDIAAIANSHRGSPSIDGTDHAAVSATYAVSKAMAGRAIEAADYAAYAIVYAYGRYAVNDPSSFDIEHTWQVETFKALAQAHHAMETTPSR